MTYEVTAEADKLRKAMKQAPAATYKHLRDFAFRALADHRTAMFRGRKGKFRRFLNAVVPQINEGVATPRGSKPAGPDKRSLVYSLVPVQREDPRGRFDRIQFSIRSRNSALRSFEFGDKVKPDKGKYIAIPVLRGKRNRVSPSTFRRRHLRKGRALIAIEKGDKALLFERSRKRTHSRRRRRLTKSGRARKSQPRVKTDVLKLRYVLVREFTVKRRLGFYQRWDEQLGRRKSLFRTAVNKLMREIDGKP